jgi:hypothetical protein
MKGTIYLVQPPELVGTNRYKFGMSHKSTLNRIKSYGKDTIILSKFYIKNPLKIENFIKVMFDYLNIKILKQEFPVYDNENELINLFNSLVKLFNFGYYYLQKKIKNNKNYQIKNNEIKNYQIENYQIKNDKNDEIKEYICLRCNLNCGRFKTHLRNHFLRKNKCNTDYNDIDCEILIEKINNNTYINYYNELRETGTNNYKCPYCPKTYKYQSGMCKHRNKCIQNPNNKNLTKNKINNIKNQTNNQINININSFGNEEYDINQIIKKLNFILDYSNFNGNQLQSKDKINNIISNYNVIFDHLYSNPKNYNYNIVNKKNKICKIKDRDSEQFIHIHFNDLVDKIFNIIYKIFNLSIIDFEFKNDDISLKHYKDFQQKIISSKDKYIKEYIYSNDIEKKNNIKKHLFIFYKGFQDILSNIKNKILLKVYDF